MTPVVVLAYDGELEAAAIPALARQWSADIVTVTVDVGQSRDVRAVREIALAAGAVRAYVVDAVDEFVRHCVLPALQASAGDRPLRGSTRLAHPIIAARLVQSAHREQTRLVAHGGGDRLTAAIRDLDPSLQVVRVESARSPARDDGATARHASKDRRSLSLSRYDPQTTTGREECSSRPVVRMAFARLLSSCRSARARRR